MALQVFHEKTIVALRVSTHSTEEWKDTALFLEIITNLWKLLNCKSRFEQIRLRDDHRVPITFNAQGDYALTALRAYATMADKMRASPNQKRVKQLTVDTGDAAWHTLNGLASLSEYLMCQPTSDPLWHEYVLLGFQQDDLEHHFGHFRRSAGCNYYISVQDTMMSHRIDCTRLLLQTMEDEMDKEMPGFSHEAGSKR